MTPEEIKAQILRMEAFADGIKQGSRLFAEWSINVLTEEAKSKLNKGTSSIESGGDGKSGS